MQPMTDPNIQFWCFLSRGPIQDHNRRLGRICSLKYYRITEYPAFGEIDGPYETFIPNPNFVGGINFFQTNVALEYQLEYNLELGRRRLHSNLPSRFSALFVFDDLDEAHKADDKYHWSQDSDLVKLRPTDSHILCSYSRHDMQYVSMARGQWTMAGDDLEAMIGGYWEGVDCKGVEYLGRNYPSTPIWEYLYDGALSFVD